MMAAAWLIFRTYTELGRTVTVLAMLVAFGVAVYWREDRTLVRASVAVIALGVVLLILLR